MGAVGQTSLFEGKTDAEIAQALIRPYCRGPGELVYFVMEGNPASKARARFDSVRKRTYEPKSNRIAEKATAWYFRAAFAEPYEGTMFLGAVFYRPDRHRIDADNMLKHLCDAGTGIAWVDDSQITGVLGLVEYDHERPRTLVVVAPYQSSMERGPTPERACEQCGTEFRPQRRSPSQKAVRFCSNACSQRFRGTDLSEPVACRFCGRPFQRRSASSVLCSNECRMAERQGQNRSGRPLSSCSSCGKTLAHRRGGQCRECWRANPVRDEA